jgi:hypothetical protein
MNDSDFAALVESIEQAGRIKRGVEPPSRVYSVDESGHIVLSHEQWNFILDHVEDLEDALAVYKARWELATGREELIELTPEQIHEWLDENGDDMAS